MSQGQANYLALQGLAQNAHAQANQPPPKPSVASRIRDRINELQRVRENYIGYLEYRKSEADWHGCWDAAVNISETECEIAGLKFALDALEAG